MLLLYVSRLHFNSNRRKERTENRHQDPTTAPHPRKTKARSTINPAARPTRTEPEVPMNNIDVHAHTIVSQDSRYILFQLSCSSRCLLLATCLQCFISPPARYSLYSSLDRIIFQHGNQLPATATSSRPDSGRWTSRITLIDIAG